MQRGELKFWVAVACAGACALALFAVVLLIALWPYHVLVALCLLVVLLMGALSFCVLALRGSTTQPLPKA